MKYPINYNTTTKFTSHTLGNAVSFASQKILKAFPKGFLRNVNISTTMAYKYFDVFKNIPPRVMKAPKPFMVIQPRFDTDMSDSFLSESYLTTRITDNDAYHDWGNLIPLVDDRHRGYSIKFLMNRVRMHFDVSVVFETQMQQINWYQSLRNQFTWSRPVTWRGVLEHHIPREIIAGVAYISDTDMSCPHKILRVMNAHSINPITYKMKTSTGCDEYFAYQQTPMDVIFQGLDIDDSGRTNMVDGTYGVNFTVSMEFMTGGAYHIFTTKRVPPLIFANGAAISPEGDGKIEVQFSSIDEIGVVIPDGWEVVAFPSYRTDMVKKGEPDVVEIGEVIPEYVTKIITYHLENELPLEPLVKFIVSRDNERLIEDEHFVVDLRNFKLYTYLLNRKSTYRLFVIINNEYINNLDMALLDREDK